MPRLIPPLVPPGRLADGDQPEIPVDAELVLRPWEPADAATAVAAFADPEIQRWHFRRLDSLAEAEEWIAGLAAGWRAETSANWAIAPTDGGPPVGRIALTTIHLPGARGQVSYWVLPGSRGRGVASRAVAALARWSFADLGLERIELKHSVENPASCAVASRTGFSPEGTLRRALFHDDGWHDLHLHARLATDA